MSKRKSSRDLMADLLSDKSERGETVEKSSSSADSVRRKATLRPDPKVKMTLSLPSSIADRLTQFETEMRLHTGERGHALAKSAIISTALEMMLDEYDLKGMDSQIALQMDPRQQQF